jgi:hypothetical protein
MERTMKNENDDSVRQRRGSSPMPLAPSSRNDNPSKPRTNETNTTSDMPGEKKPTESDTSRWQDDGGESAESAS